MPFRAGLLLARLWVAAFVVLTAAYCLLAYIPFTYHQVVLGSLLPWLSAFARLHSYLYWLAFAAAAATLPLRIGKTRLGSILFVVAYGVVGVALLFRPLFLRPENNLESLILCLLAWSPLLWLAVLDWRAQHARLRWVQEQPGEAQRLFRACLLAAIYSWLVSAILVIVRDGFAGHAGPGLGQSALTLAASLFSHLVVFMAIFLALNFTRAAAGIVFKDLARRALLYAASLALLLALALKIVVFAPLSFSGSWATLAALVAALSMFFFWLGITACLYRPEDGEIESPLALLLLPLKPVRSLSPTVQALVLLVAAMLFAWLLTSIRTMDWEYLLQKLAVVGIWSAAFSFFYVTATPAGKRRADSLVLAAAVVVSLYAVFLVLPLKSPVMGHGRKSLDEYEGYDVSFRLARNLLAPPLAAAGDNSLYRFLANNTNISRSVRTDPAEIDLAGTLTESSGPKPNIFIFVIDSLRRDYLSTYNPSVTFTPNIDAFARESAVARNAFTRYTGTGLSEPSIWTGAMLLHKQYITPFYPMNSLQKLLEFEQYRQFITKDEILSTILAPSNLVTQLDAGRPTMNCELCRSLAELQAKLAEAGSAGRPIFAYTQPQNIHVSVINRQGRSVPPGESYPGFDAAYASRIKAMDECFGQFIRLLKSSELYDRSIVILTSDHGDSLGERGRWGHAYHITPEVVRIPLIIHLPAAMHSLSFDPNAPSSLLDITSSLYYLLGHKPITRNDLFGRPLFTATAEEAAGYLHSSYLVASSYGPVYGLLGNSGHSLYVADAVEYQDHSYDWKDGVDVRADVVAPDLSADRRQQIRDDVNEIARFYRFQSLN
jgi:hypothetical protein